jgi:hypothetical protein
MNAQFSIAALVGLAFLSVVGDSGAVDSVEHFDVDPGWAGKNNQFPEGRAKEKEFDLGYSVSNHAGGVEPGEIGGRLWRSLTPAYYAKAIAAASLQEKLFCSGTFSVTASQGGGVLFGWFNRDSRGWRTPNSLLMRIDGESSAFRMFFEYGTRRWETGGGNVFEGERYQTTPTSLHRADGKAHRFTLSYDPAGANNRGEITFVLDGESYRAALAEGHKSSGATFDRFGILNQQVSGNEITVWFDDLSVNSQPFAFDADPEWEGLNNRLTFTDRVVRPFHDIGFRATNRAGGNTGEIGGTIWRIEPNASHGALQYGAPVAGLDLSTPLSAAGRITMEIATVDSGMYIGWFDSNSPPGAPPVRFVVAMLEGPSRAGHYFRPAFNGATDAPSVSAVGPVLRADRRPHEFAIRYAPSANGGRGQIVTVLDGREVVLALPEGARSSTLRFDRFGILSINQGGHCVEVYLDDLMYTSAP